MYFFLILAFVVCFVALGLIQEILLFLLFVCKHFVVNSIVDDKKGNLELFAPGKFLTRVFPANIDATFINGLSIHFAILKGS